jgi:hypothetical protein
MKGVFIWPSRPPPPTDVLLEQQSTGFYKHLQHLSHIPCAQGFSAFIRAALLSVLGVVATKSNDSHHE